MLVVRLFGISIVTVFMVISSTKLNSLLPSLQREGKSVFQLPGLVVWTPHIHKSLISENSSRILM